MAPKIDPSFQSNPDVMKKTRMLVVDHNVCRFHSFDLFMWFNYQLAKKGDFSTYSKIDPKFLPMMLPTVSMSERVRIYRTYATSPDPYSCYRGLDKELTVAEYETLLNEMMTDSTNWVTPTDISTAMDPIFVRSDVEGYLLRYAEDRNVPIYTSNMTVYERDNVLDLDYTIKLIQKHRINAIMMDSTDRAMHLTMKLQEVGYKDHLTFMIARYGYNFEFRNGEPYQLKHNLTLGRLELEYHHEYGYFDPFTGMSAERYDQEHYDDDQPPRNSDDSELPDITRIPGLYR